MYGRLDMMHGWVCIYKNKHQRISTEVDIYFFSLHLLLADWKEVMSNLSSTWLKKKKGCVFTQVSEQVSLLWTPLLSGGSQSLRPISCQLFFQGQNQFVKHQIRFHCCCQYVFLSSCICHKAKNRFLHWSTRWQRPVLQSVGFHSCKQMNLQTHEGGDIREGKRS